MLELGLGHTHNRLKAGYEIKIKCFKYRSNYRFSSKGKCHKTLTF